MRSRQANLTIPSLFAVALLCNPGPLPAQETEEISAKEAPATFSTGVNLVNVPVVVRDKHLQVVGNLKKEDFLLYDNGKPQSISRFSIEKSSPESATPVAAEPETPTAAGEAEKKGPPIPDRFIAFIFDDLHLDIGDLQQARQAIRPFIGGKQEANSRVAILTTSGLSTVDFTDDAEKLRKAVDGIMPRSRQESRTTSCPPFVSHYVADQIVNRDNSLALSAIAALVFACDCPTQGSQCPVTQSQAQAEARADAQQSLGINETELRTAILVLKNIIRRMSAMPGQRTAVLVSPGFLTVDEQPELTELINSAVRQNVVLNTLDARGLYVDPMLDVSRPSMPFAVQQSMNGLDREEQFADGEVLGELAEGTGGTWFHNNNSLSEGFRRSVARPEVIYLLGYSAGELKTDGKFHKIKVVLKSPAGYAVQARRGYYAPTHRTDAVEQAKQDIEDALFSHDKLGSIPLTVHTQFYKSAEDAAKLAVLAHIDLGHLRFRKAEGRNHDELTIVSGLFDRDGKFVTANQEILTLRVKDEHLDANLRSGITVKSNFDVKPGAYLVRLVVRDSEGKELAATNGSVEIP